MSNLLPGELPDEVASRDDSSDHDPSADGLQTTPFSFPPLMDGVEPSATVHQDDSTVRVAIEYGSTSLEGSEFEDLGPDALLSLDESIDEHVRVVVDGQVIGTGVVIVVDGKIAIEITRLLGFEPSKSNKKQDAA